jgi:light-regulated signal transduction histidine kinase (bacteriophytochrome)
LLYELQQLLVQIKSCSEVTDEISLQNVNHLSKYGLNLLHYALFAIEYQQTELPMTSVSASGAMHDVIYELRPLAKAYGVTVSFDYSSELEPVYANEVMLKGSIYSLASALITGNNNIKNITIAVQQTKPKVQRIGIYSNDIGINTSFVKKSLSNAKNVNRMYLPKFSHRSGLGFAVSKELADRLNAKFCNFEHIGGKGVGFYLPESAQLSFL